MALTTLEKYKKIQKELVAEQSGLTFLILGLIFSFVVGTWIKSWMGFDSTQPLLKKAMSEISTPLLDIQFKNSFISLSDGWLPEIALIIEDVTIKSEDECLLRPELQIHRAKLPLRFQKLLQGEIQFTHLHLDETHLLIRSEMKNCEAALPQPAKVGSPSSVAATGATSVAADNKNSLFNLNSKNQMIDKIVIDSLVIHYLPRAFTSVEFKNTVFETVKKDSSINMKSLLLIQGETFQGDYSSQAQVHLSYQPQNEKTLNLQVSGLLREGQYSLEGFYSIKENRIQLQLNAKHLPLSQLEPLLRKFNWIKQDIQSKNLWISFQVTLKKDFDKNQTEDFNAEFSFLKIEGDIGEIYVPEIKVLNPSPLQLAPFKMIFSSLNLNVLFKLLDQEQPSEGLGNLGVFRGELFFENLRKMKLQGDLSGLEFIFSNQGSRVAQTLTLASGILNLKNDQWELLVDQIKLLEGVFLGDVRISGDTEFKKIKLHSQFEDLTLSPSVQKLMTLGGEIGSFSGKIDSAFNGGHLSQLNGHLQLPKATFSGMQIEKLRFEFYIQDLVQNINLNLDKLRFQVSNPLSQYFRSFINFSSEEVLLSQFQGSLSGDKLKNLRWKNLRFFQEKNEYFSWGQWNDRGEVEGLIQQVKPAPGKKWKLSGTRDQPIIEGPAVSTPK